MNRPNLPDAASNVIRLRLLVRGVVQGVGFRPFVHRLASEYALPGWVLNSTEGVVIEVEGSRDALSRFQQDLVRRKPPLAIIERVEANWLPPVGYTTFTIESSRADMEGFVLVSPDIATCPDCLREVWDPSDRRYRYPFTNCTNCGPRFTIVRDIPYDRPKTTMAHFPLCPECAREYHDPNDRRFHAQPVACPVCGPRLWLAYSEDDPGDDEQAMPQGDQAILAAQRLLAQGKVVAVKGLGGFHLACDATSDAAVSLLRQRKGRVDKPFAIMCPDLATVEALCFLTEGERELLLSPQRPIVILRRRPDAPISRLVAPGNNTLGVMLPYTPLHHLLLSPPSQAAIPDLKTVLVMTSGNYSEEPIATENEEARTRLSPLADACLLHNRPIHIRCDDSVTRLFRGKEMVLRRSRGYAPFPVRLPFAVPPILAVGGELKNTFCLTRDIYAFLSQHIGDMENAETLASFEQSVAHFQRLFRIQPQAIAHDTHPEYLSTKWAQEQSERTGIPLHSVQHHHAHMAACMAENGLTERVIGVSWDGTGYGLDGAIWGGEFLVGNYGEFQRAAFFRYVRLPGGEAAIRRPYRMALSHLFHAFGEAAWGLNLAFMAQVPPMEMAIIRHQIVTGLNSPLTSSAGRLFDAVSALLGIRGVVNYEGQAAIEMEMLASEGLQEGEVVGAYALPPLATDAFPWEIDPAPIIRAVVKDIQASVPAPIIAVRFHRTMATCIAAVCDLIRQRQGLNTVCLSGGVFQNMLLLEQTVSLLEEKGFRVYTHHQVPPNDGGICLGQAMVAAAQGFGVRAMRHYLIDPK